MKRLLLGLAAILAIGLTSGARPVFADQPSPTENAGLAARTAGYLVDEVDPAQWPQRHVCAGVELVDHYWCFYFPFPT